MYRIGKKQKRAILTADGNEVVVFPKGKEAIAEKVCNLLNADLEVNKISPSAMLADSVCECETPMLDSRDTFSRCNNCHRPARFEQTVR